MGVACSTPGRDDAYKLRSENLKGRVHSEELCIDGRIILEWMLDRVGS
jgi:hypothetical protein